MLNLNLLLNGKNDILQNLGANYVFKDDPDQCTSLP